MKVLLAEGSTIVLEIEKKYLQETGASIFTASTAEEVMAAARKVKPHLIYLSLGIPSGGDDCCRALKSDPGLWDIPVIMVCAQSGGEKKRCRNAGCDGVISRPIERREFLAAARAFMPASAEEERVPCRALVQCRRADQSFFGTIEDVSMDGLFVGSQHRVKAGEVLGLRFLLPWSGAGLIRTAGQVSWVNGGRSPRNRRLPQGFGISFQGIDPHAADQISDYLELMRKRLGE